MAFSHAARFQCLAALSHAIVETGDTAKKKTIYRCLKKKPGPAKIWIHLGGEDAYLRAISSTVDTFNMLVTWTRKRA